MRANLFLADYAQTVPGLKINALGLGWSSVTTPLPHHALVLLVELEAHELNVVQADLVLLNEAGDVVHDDADNETRARFEFRPEITPGGQPTDAVLPATLDVSAGMPLPAGAYRWRAVVTCGERVEQVDRPFQVRAATDRAPAAVAN